MSATPNALTTLDRSSYSAVDEPTMVILLDTPIEEPVTELIAVVEPAEPAEPADGPSLAWPLVTTLLPALVLALLVGVVAGRDLAPYLGAAIGAVGAASGVRKAIRGY